MMLTKYNFIILIIISIRMEEEGSNKSEKVSPQSSLQKQKNKEFDSNATIENPSQKQSPKEVKSIGPDKTQRIKKAKKQQKKASLNEQTSGKGEMKRLQDKLANDAVRRLKEKTSIESKQSTPLWKKLTRERLLQFLEAVEAEYSTTVNCYLKTSTNLEQSGTLKSLLLRYIDTIVEAFPVLNNIIFQYASKYYSSGPLFHRFNRLMARNITPILKIISEKYNGRPSHHFQCDKNESISTTNISQSPEKEFLEDYQERDAKKAQKRRKKKLKKKQQLKQEKNCDWQDEQVVEQEQIEKKMKKQIDPQQNNICSMLQALIIEDDSRVQCRVSQQSLEHWKQSAKLYLGKGKV